MSSQGYQIGGWRFDPQEPVLRRDGEVRPLEDRAARTLDLLCRRRGAVVGKDEMIAQVWQGRTVSPNSVAVVIGSLRRALDDDTAAPVHIVTVNKRGYRLVEEARTGPEATGRGVRVHWLWPAAAAALMAVLGLGALLLRPSAPAVELVVEPVRNETGRSDLDPLARSLGSVVVDGAVRIPNASVRYDAAQPRQDRIRPVAVRSRLILWGGVPELAIQAIDLGTGKVIWSGFAAGAQGDLARSTTDRLAKLGRALTP